MPNLQLGGAAALGLLVALVATSPAAAQTRCHAPDELGWRSCLTVSHRAIDGGTDLELTRARPRLVERFERCPAQRLERRVVIRTGDRRLGATTVRSRCARGVARWEALVELDATVKDGAVVRSFWTGVADDESSAPRVTVRTGG